MSSKKYELKKFQEKTAERIFSIFHDEKQNRVLLADEVGLGKTIVARAVIKRVKDWHLEEGVETSENKIVKDDLFKVVYVCSNEVIARQNTSKLGVPRDSQVPPSESRLSMQHLYIAEQEMDSLKKKNNFQLLSMTPSTSLDLKNGQGLVQERALIYCILKGYGLDPDKLDQFFLLKYKNNDVWKTLKEKFQERIDKVHSQFQGKYPEKLYDSLHETLKKEQFQDFMECFEPNKSPTDESLFDRFVPKLRYLFAQLSLEQLEPDLIIMDEFQRFNSLIKSSDASDLGILCQKFFNSANPLKTKILLMSATPYKPYSTLAEVVDPDSPKHFEDFKSVFRFLYSDPDSSKNFGDFEAVWKDYSNSLQELRQKDWSVLIAKKNKAEDELRSVLSRTERQNDRIIKTTSWESNSNSMAISEGDVLSYYNVCKIIRFANDERQKAGEPPIPSIPVEYAKSSPYLLSFMRDQYKINTLLREHYANKNIPQDKTSFLNKNAINSYKLIPANNARLQKLYDTILPKDKRTELLLWVPPSHPYYSTENSANLIGKAFNDNKGFSKLLLFSAWEMVPRMTAAMTSYEAERRVFNRLNNSRLNKRARKIEERYFVKRISQSLPKSSKKLLTFPSKYLADVYTPSEYEGQSLTEILSYLKNDIKNEIVKLKEKYKIPDSDKTSVQQTLLLLKLLDEIHKSGENEVQQTNDNDMPKAIPADTAELLAYMAIASPAVCALRTLNNFKQKSFAKIYKMAKRLANGFVTLFSQRNARAIIKLSFRKTKKPYYFNVLQYCADGNFQAMLDEYAFVCGNVKQFIQNMTPQKIEGKKDQRVPYLCTSRTEVDTRKSYKNRSMEQMSMRTNFAMGYYNVRQTDNTILHADAIRTAFNMPFRPFVLSTTSIGQEGLDFHAYCRKIMHWNLPQNPIDLEQREGRINRYMSLAIRQSLANSHYANVPLDDFWTNLINNVKEGKNSKTLCGDMVPYWILPTGKDNEEFENPQFPIERIVPAYPYSKDQDKYSWIIKVLSMYRLTLGQPNQEELLRSLDNANIPKEQLDELFFNLSPFFGKQKEKAETES